MQLFINNYTTTLTADVDAADTQLSIPEEDAERLIGLGEGGYCFLTYAERDSSGKETAWEIIRVTGRDGGVLDVQRGQEDTAALDMPAGAELQMRLTAGVFAGLTSQLSALTQSLAGLPSQLSVLTQSLAELDARVAALEHDPNAPQTFTVTVAGNSYTTGYTRGSSGNAISPTEIAIPGHGNIEIDSARFFADTPRRFVLIFLGEFPPGAISALDVMGCGVLTVESAKLAVNEQDGSKKYTVYEWDVEETDWLDSIGQDRTIEISFA